MILSYDKQEEILNKIGNQIFKTLSKETSVIDVGDKGYMEYHTADFRHDLDEINENPNNHFKFERDRIIKGAGYRYVYPLIDLPDYKLKLLEKVKDSLGNLADSFSITYEGYSKIYDFDDRFKIILSYKDHFYKILNEDENIKNMAISLIGLKKYNM